MEDSSLVHDVDVLAVHRPGDVRVQHVTGLALLSPTAECEDPSSGVTERLARLVMKRAEWLWDQNAPALVAQINAARGVESSERYDVLVEALQSQKQRILNLAAQVAQDMREHLGRLGPGGETVGDAMLLLAQGDGASRTGVTELTRTGIEMMVYAVADHLHSIVAERDVTSRELRLLLEGGPGAAVIGRFMYEQLRDAHPLLRSESSGPTDDGSDESE